MPVPTLIYNNATPNNIPLKIELPNGSLLPLVPGLSLTFQLLTADSTGATTGAISTLGTATIGNDGSSVDINPTTTGQFGYAVLNTTAGPINRAGATATTSLFLLFIDQIDALIYDTANITGHP